jgi:hypothetical protein
MFLCDGKQIFLLRQQIQSTIGIYLNSLNKPYYVRVVTPHGTSQAITYSVESYAYQVLETELGEEIDEATKNYLVALIAFGDALQAYDAAAAAPADPAEPAA